MPITPSPLVLINGFPQINGINVTADSTISISLASSAGVYAWNTVCVGTDELLTVATINGTLVINNANYSATFSTPNDSNAHAMIFSSTINNGVDVNGVIQPAYTTTFGVYIVTATLHNRVGAQNETVEGDSTYGWLTKLNPLIRSLG